jgi:NAD+ kinase
MEDRIRIAVYGRPLNSPRISDILQFLSKINTISTLYISKDFLESLSSFNIAHGHTYGGADDFPEVDVLVSIGGDGTLLDCVSLVRDTNIPIWGINIGRLGFLTFTSLDDVDDALVALINKEYTIESRSMIEVEADGLLPPFPSALNEVTVQKQDASMITVHAYIDGEFLGTYWSDGVIVATPTGSTAYSMSIGGPIVDPHSSVFVISPIAPHNLNMRPLVVPDTSRLRLEVESRTGHAIWSMDNHRFALSNGSSLLLKKSDAQINFVKFKGANFCINLRNKLLWGLDKRN